MGFSVHVSPHISPHISVPHISPHIAPHVEAPHVSPHFSEPSAPHSYSEPVRPSTPPMYWFVHPHYNNGTTSTQCDDGSEYCHHYAPSSAFLVSVTLMIALIVVLSVRLFSR